MVPLPPAIETSLFTSQFILLSAPEALKFVIVKNGVANVTNGKYFLRVDISHLGYEDGYYDFIANRGNGAYLRPAETKKVYDGILNTGIDPEILKPDFANLAPLCVIEYPAELFDAIRRDIVTPAKKHDDKIAIDKNGIGLKRNGSIYMDFKFNVPDVMYFDARHVQAVFTDVSRHETVYIYQEKGPIYEEGPLTPLIIGSGWRNCSILFPIPDRHRNHYS